MLQHTPLSVIEEPPLTEALPPLYVADVPVIEEMIPELTTGCNSAVLKFNSVPYDVPTELVAYALT